MVHISPHTLIHAWREVYAWSRRSSHQDRSSSATYLSIRDFKCPACRHLLSFARYGWFGCWKTKKCWNCCYRKANLGYQLGGVRRIDWSERERESLNQAKFHTSGSAQKSDRILNFKAFSVSNGRSRVLHQCCTMELRNGAKQISHVDGTKYAWCCIKAANNVIWFFFPMFSWAGMPRIRATFIHFEETDQNSRGHSRDDFVKNGQFLI